jgi:hypothetical protein
LRNINVRRNPPRPIFAKQRCCRFQGKNVSAFFSAHSARQSLSLFVDVRFLSEVAPGKIDSARP